MVIKPWLNLPTGGHGHVICMGNLGGGGSCENTLEGCTETHKSYFFPYKQVSGKSGDHEWLRMTNAFILCDWLWKVQKGHAANREGSFCIVGVPTLNPSSMKTMIWLIKDRGKLAMWLWWFFLWIQSGWLILSLYKCQPFEKGHSNWLLQMVVQHSIMEHPWPLTLLL